MCYSNLKQSDHLFEMDLFEIGTGQLYEPDPTLYCYWRAVYTKWPQAAFQFILITTPPSKLSSLLITSCGVGWGVIQNLNCTSRPFGWSRHLYIL